MAIALPGGNRVKYLDRNGDEQTVDAAVYMVNKDVEPAVIRLKPNQQWPSALAVENSVWVEFTAGYEDIDGDPQPDHEGDAVADRGLVS